MNFTSGQQVFNELLKSIDTNESAAFLKWIIHTSELALKELNDTSAENTVLNQIRADLRQTLPLEAVLDSENIVYPTTGDNADCARSTTVHVDAFLYDDEAIDELVEEGKMSRNYCKKCGSHQVAALTFISHSMSSTQLQYIFKYLLPDLQDKLLVDVGSRLGPVLYGAYLYSRASRIVGVEMNVEFCQLQQKVIEKYNMQDRIQIICDDICNQLELLQNADVVVMNNVFEFFADLEIQKRIWTMIHQSVRKSGTYLVVTPSLEESLQSVQLTDLINGWITPINRPESLIAAEYALFSDRRDTDLSDVYLYAVL